MRILMVGLDNSGKTTFVLKINGEDTSVISPTLGFNIKTIAYNKYTLNIWDVGGQKTIRSYWRNYFEQTDGLALRYAIQTYNEHKSSWEGLMKRGMTRDYTWVNAATQYEQVIEWAFIDPPYC